MRIRGLDRSLLTYAETSEKRLQNIQGFGFSANFNLGNKLLSETNYEQSQAQITDGGAYPVEQGNWDMTRFYYRVDLKSKVTSFLNIDLFFKQYWSNVNGFHPTLNAQIYNSSHRHFEGGLSLPYQAKMNEKWTGNISYLFSDIRREDNFLGLSHYIPWNTLHIGMEYDLQVKAVGLSFNVALNSIKVGDVVEYNDMSDWYYQMITAEEIVYYSQDRNIIHAGLKITFPVKDIFIALSGTYQNVSPINLDAKYHSLQTQIDIMF
jgi:hypothetical protein